VKSEHSFLELINAAVSHELRNPLNSLIGQVESMEDFFLIFRSVINEIKESPAVIEKLSKIQKGLENCGNKMSSACKFIDFFVHDILDYTILNKESKNFIKDKKTFDISEAIKEITDILNDKSKLKNVKIQTHFRGFDDHHMVKTDRKRLQQVILNFVSNAVKFSERDG
jgi:signal transduction histidine kinase